MSTLETRILRIKAQTPTRATKPLDSLGESHRRTESPLPPFVAIDHHRSPEEHSEISWFAVEDAPAASRLPPGLPVLLRRVASVTSSTERGVQA